MLSTNICFFELKNKYEKAGFYRLYKNLSFFLLLSIIQTATKPTNVPTIVIGKDRIIITGLLDCITK